MPKMTIYDFPLDVLAIGPDSTSVVMFTKPRVNVRLRTFPLKNVYFIFHFIVLNFNQIILCILIFG